MPLQCSMFLTRHANILKQTNASGAAYLFQPDKLNAEYDLGDKTIQCGRRPDAYKLWLAWKVINRPLFGCSVCSLSVILSRKAPEHGDAMRSLLRWPQAIRRERVVISCKRSML